MRLLQPRAKRPVALAVTTLLILVGGLLAAGPAAASAAPKPAITSVSPSRGKAGVTELITGAGFAKVTKVSFHGVSARFRVLSSDEITATVPAKATSGVVSVTAGARTATSKQSFQIDDAVSSFTPTAGGVGRAVTINGSGFVKPCKAAFNSTPASCTVSSATKILTVVPAMATTGTISVTIDGFTQTSASKFTVTLGLELSPRSGPPSSLVTVSGSGYDPHELVDLYIGEADEALVATNAHGDFSYPGFPVPASSQPGTAWVSAVGRRSTLAAQEPFTVSTNWAQFGYGPTHSGTNPYENTLNLSNVGDLSLLWSFRTGAAVTSTPAVVDGVVYVGAKDSLEAIKAATGARLWSFATSGTVSSSPAVVGGVVYFGTSGLPGVFYALEATTGAKLWSTLTGPLVDSSPAIVKGVVYVGTSDGSLMALNASTGSRSWLTGPIDAVESSPAVSNGVEYVGSDEFTIWAINPSNGHELWDLVTGGDVVSSPTVYDNVVYVGSDDDRLYAIDATKGTELWNFSVTPNDGTGVTSSPTVVDGVVYVGYPGGGVYALDAFGGGVIWGDTISGDVEGKPAVANGVVYVGSTDHDVYAIDAATGARLWAFRTGAAVDASAVVANGVVYVGSTDGNLYAFSVPGGPAGSAVRRVTLADLRPDLLLKAST